MLGARGRNARGLVRSGTLPALALTAALLPAPPAAEAAAPNPPELVAPAPDYVFGSTEPQVFTVRVTDPEGDRWVGEIEVTDLDDGAVTAFATTVSTSGGFASGVATPPLRLGRYSWRARATDTTGSTSGWSASASFRVGTNDPPHAPTLLAPADGATLDRVGNEPFAIGAVDPNGDPYTGTITVLNASGVEVTKLTTSPAPSGGASFGILTAILAEGAYTWWAVATDVHGASSASSSARSFTVGPPATLGGGTGVGTMTYASPGLPTTIQSCEPSSSTFGFTSAAAVFNTAIVGYVGPVTIDGTGSSPCESALFGTGSMAATVTGIGATGSTLTCSNLTGSYTHAEAVLALNLAGGCTINNLPVSRVALSASLAFTSTDPRAGLTARILTASIGGVFTVRPE